MSNKRPLILKKARNSGRGDYKVNLDDKPKFTGKITESNKGSK